MVGGPLGPGPPAPLSNPGLPCDSRMMRYRLDKKEENNFCLFLLRPPVASSPDILIDVQTCSRPPPPARPQNCGNEKCGTVEEGLSVWVIAVRTKFHWTRATVNSVNSEVSGRNVTKMAHDVEIFILSNVLKSELRYCSPFPNGSNHVIAWPVSYTHLTLPTIYSV